MNWEELGKYFHDHGRRRGHSSLLSFKNSTKLSTNINNNNNNNEIIITKTTSKSKRIDLIKDLLNKTNKSLNKSNKFQNIKRFFSFNSKEDVMIKFDSNGEEKEDEEEECIKAADVATICSLKSTSSSSNTTQSISSISNSNESLSQMNDSSPKSTVYYNKSQSYRSSTSYLSSSFR